MSVQGETWENIYAGHPIHIIKEEEVDLSDSQDFVDAITSLIVSWRMLIVQSASIHNCDI
jgi:hypothetical protein